jgi:hypothetical protein
MIEYVEALRGLGLSYADLRDPFLRNPQRVFDKEAFDHEWPLMRAGVDFKFAKTEHIGNHIGKALGKVLNMRSSIPGSTETVRLEAFPDTLIYRTQLANTLRYDLKKRLGKSVATGSSIDDVDDLLTEARVAIDKFDERTDHDKYVPEYMRVVKEVAIPALHYAGLTMANIFDIEPREAHFARIVHRLRISTTVLE